MRPVLAITVVAAFAATTACGSSGDRIGEELPPVRISSVSTSTSAAPTTTAAAAPTSVVTTPPDPSSSTTAASSSVVVPATTVPSTSTPATSPPTTIGTSPTTIGTSPTTTPVATAAPTTAAPSGNTSGNTSGNGPGTIEGGATVGAGAGRGGASPADRVQTPVLLAWIGGADVVDDDNGWSLPAAAASRMGRIDDRPVEVRAFTDPDPDLSGIDELIGDAIADGAAGLVVAISPTLAAFGGTGTCDGTSPNSAFIACLFEPPTGADLAERSSQLQALATTLADSGLPVFVYVSGVSAQALADTDLGADVSAAESAIAAVDPNDTNVRFGADVITRDVSDADEGTAFVDAITPSSSGVELLADLLAPDIEAFFNQQLG